MTTDTTNTIQYNGNTVQWQSTPKIAFFYNTAEGIIRVYYMLYLSLERRNPINRAKTARVRSWKILQKYNQKAVLQQKL